MNKYLLSLMMLLPLTTFVYAQDNDEDKSDTEETAEVEEIVTTGIKSSLIDAIEIKRNKVGVTEIITAEDVGKFPDGNIAEALARVSGIAIDRSNIEGKEVSVRGMGAQYNMVTLNGRTMPVAPTEYAGGRAFDFGAISSHGIARLEVYKTQNPALPSGGLGATINMVSARPLEAENGGAISALLMEDTTSVVGDKDLTPEIEFIHNYKSEFNGMEWGVSVSGSYHERQNREEGTNEITWLPSTLDAPVYGPNLTDYFSDGSVNYRPTAFNIRYKDNDRIRKNLAATLQFGFDNVVATIDAVYSGVDFSTDGFMAGAPLNIPYSTPYGAGIGLDNVVIDKNGVVTQLEIVGSGTNLTQAVTFGQEDTSNQSLGFNLTWDVNDQLTLSFDVHNSYAQFKGGNNELQFANASWSGWGDGQPSDNGNPYEQWAELTNLTFTGNDNIPVMIPTTSVGFQSFARTVRDLEGRDMSSTTGQLNNNDRNSKILQYQFKGSWQNLNGMLTDSLVSVDFGISSMKQKFTRVLRSNVLTAPIGYDYSPGSLIWGPNFWDDNAFTKTDASYLLSDSADAAAIPYYMHISYEDAVAGYNNGYWTSSNGFDCDEGVPNCFGPAENGARVTETMDSLFVQANFEGDLNGMPWKLVTSLRHEAIGLSTPQEYTVPTGTFIGTYAWTDGPYFIKGPDFRTVSGSYKSDSDIVLPSIAFSIAPTENTVVRFSAGTTIARAGLEKLTPNIVFPEFLSINNPYHVLTSGNPDLKPLKSQNLDLAFEYYYAEGSYAAINLFQKDLEDFVTNTFSRVTFDGLYDVRYGLDGQPLDFGNPARAFPSMDWWVDARANHQNNVPGSTCTGAQRSWDDWFFYQDQECVTADPSINPLAQWDLARPENLNSGTIKGAEIAIQHFFTGTNFGAIFNYTFIGGDTEAGPDAVRDETFELAGFGDSGNLTVFYEDDKFSARLSNNFRAETYSGFDQYNPIWIEARHQLDASASYIINDKFTVFVEGLNLTDSEVRLYSRYENMLFLAQNHGPVYKAGFRMKF